MSDPEGFVTRWSRLKRQAVKEKAPGDGPDLPDATERREVPVKTPSSEGSAPAAFDPATLPPIESITAGSDIRSFLQSGVPAELTKAALRRAWTADPAIRDFIGLAENQWDFTDPAAIPGFGPLKATDDVHKLVAQAMGKLDDVLPLSTTTDGTPSAPGASFSHAHSGEDHHKQRNDVPDETADSVPSQPGNARSETASVAPQHELEDPPADEKPKRSRQTHGRALPR